MKLSSFTFPGVAASAIVLALLCAGAPAEAQIRDQQEVSATEGGFTGDLDSNDNFGWAPESIGDLDGDGVLDLAVGTPQDDDGGQNRGAVWILFMNPDGTVKGHQKISDTEGGFTADLDDDDEFGHSVAPLGDFDGDGVQDIAVGALHDDDGGEAHGAFYLLFLNTDGTVKAYQKVSDTVGGFTDSLTRGDSFGHGITSIGDLDGDNVDDLAAATGHIGHMGITWVLFMNADGTVREYQRITEGEGGFGGDLNPGDELGHDLNGIGDFDGDGVLDLAAGIPDNDDGGSNRGGFYLLYLDTDGTVKRETKVSDTAGGFIGRLDDGDKFGHPPKSAGDLDGDGVIDLLAGAPFDDDGFDNAGAFWILFMNLDGSVKCHQKVSQTEGGFTGDLGPGDLFAHIVSRLGDLDGDGFTDFVSGSPHSGLGGSFWVLFGDGTPAALTAGFDVRTSGLVATFTDRSFDCGRPLTNWDWDFGDGNGSTEQHPQHVYAASGSYDVTLTVTNDAAASETSVQTVTVEAMSVTPESVDFGVQDVGTTSSPTTLTVANDGPNSVDVNEVALKGADAGEFGHDFTGPVTLLPGERLFIDSWFAPTDVGVGERLYRINAGGPRVFSEGGSDMDWASDDPTVYADPSTTRTGTLRGSLSLDGAMPAEIPAALFDSYRRDSRSALPDMEWDFPVSAGEALTVRLFLMQDRRCTPGLKKFDVEIEGQIVLDDYDVAADVGCGVGVMQSFDVTPTDDNLDIDFVRGTGGRPLVSGFEIGRRGVKTAPLTIEYTATEASLVVDLTGLAITGTNAPPLADFSYTTNGLEAVFTDESTDSDGTVVEWSWDFGDGESSTEQHPTHLYAAAGVYDVSLTVTDDGGQSDSTTQPVNVSDGSSGVTYRVNAGGPELPSEDAVPLDWEADQPSPYVDPASTRTGSVAGTITVDGTVPAGVPEALFRSHRRDPSTNPPDMQWDFPVVAGEPLELRLFFMQHKGCEPGKLVDVLVEGVVELDDYDVFAEAGCKVGTMKTVFVTPADDNLDIDFVRVAGGPPLVCGFEIIANP